MTDNVFKIIKHCILTLLEICIFKFIFKGGLMPSGEAFLEQKFTWCSNKMSKIPCVSEK